MALMPFNLHAWVDENRHLLKPPVGNKCIHNGDFIVMAVGGPNERTDFHLDEGPEWFYQLEGEMVLRIQENGAVRDIRGLNELEDFVAFVRAYDPSHHFSTLASGPRLNSTMIGINTPIRIGQATVMPGDVVLGRDGGVIFIPPQLAEQVVAKPVPLPCRRFEELLGLRAAPREHALQPPGVLVSRGRAATDRTTARRNGHRH